MRRRIVIPFIIPFILLALQACKSEEPRCGSTVNITWLGVTTYALSYEYNSKSVTVLLDHQLNAAYYDQVLETLEFDALDYVFVGHNHFDHTGRCTAQGDILCDLALASTDSSNIPWEGAPYDVYAMEKYGAKVVAPFGLCETLDETQCLGIWSMDGAQRFSLDDIGLNVIAFPSAHSNAFGELDYQREHPGNADADPFSFILEFPARDSSCQASLLWTSSTLSQAPYLQYTETLEHDDATWTFDYQALLVDAMALRENKPLTYWTFYAHDLPDAAAWSQWANPIQPKAWSNHHHGIGSSIYFPDLHMPFLGSSQGGPAEAPQSPWITQTTNSGPEFIPLNSYWETVELRDGEAFHVHERQIELSERFADKVQLLLGP
ncbi:MAG: hypothetical protein HOK97_10735 [Deltaproteobacteria bacterium]|nr:hypothetical protein [Deltaproteobacteria bacterium]